MATGPIARALRAFLIAAALAVAAGPAAAQSEPPPSQGQSPAAESGAPQVDPEALKSLIETLEDDAARQKFIDNLRTLLEAQGAAPSEGEEAGVGASVVGAISKQAERLSNALVEAAGLILEAPDWVAGAAAALEDPEERRFWIDVVWQAVAVIALGVLAEWLARLLLRRPRRAVETRASDAVLVRLLFLAARTLLDILPIAAFAAAAYAVLPWAEPDETVRLALIAVIYANVLARAAMAVVRMLLTPHAPSLRLFPIGDETAAYFYVWARRLIHVAVYGYFVAEAALLLGLAPFAHAVVIDALGLAVLMLVIVFVLQMRRSAREWIRGAAGGRHGLAAMRARLGDIWHVLAVIYAVVVYLVWAFEVEGGFAYLMRATALTLVVVGVAVLAVRAVRQGAERLFTVSRELEERYPGIGARANRYLPVAVRAVRVVIGALAGLALLQVWGIDVLAWLASGPGRGALGSLVTIAAVLVGSVVLWELVSSWIERYLEATEPGAERSQRLLTLLPLARKVISVAMVVFVSLIVLSELGVDIAPLLAGAGVVGLAIGFGAQTLVKDVITGLFILVQDTIAVGDVVTVAGHTGVVESLSIRSLTLRDLSGTAQTIPFSEVTTVQNMSKGYSYALIDAGVAYREDTDEVAAEMMAIAEEMAADETFGENIIGPPEMFGVNELGDSAVVVRLRFMVKPGTQWGLQREFNRRMKKRFDQKGIEIPFPHMTLYMGEDKAGNAPPINVREIDGAAHESAPPARRKRAASASEAEAEQATGDTSASQGEDE